MASGTPFRFVRGETPQTRAGTPFHFIRQAARTARPGTPFQFVRGTPIPGSSLGVSFDNSVKAALVDTDKLGAVADHLVRSIDPALGSVFDSSARFISPATDLLGGIFDSTIRAVFPATDQLGIVYDNTAQRVDPEDSIVGSVYDNTVSFIPPVTSSGLGATVDGVILPFIDGRDPNEVLADQLKIKGQLDPRRPVGTGDGLGAGVSGYEESADRIVGEIIT